MMLAATVALALPSCFLKPLVDELRDKDDIGDGAPDAGKTGDGASPTDDGGDGASDRDDGGDGASDTNDGGDGGYPADLWPEVADVSADGAAPGEVDGGEELPPVPDATADLPDGANAPDLSPGDLTDGDLADGLPVEDGVTPPDVPELDDEWSAADLIAEDLEGDNATDFEDVPPEIVNPDDKAFETFAQEFPQLAEDLLLVEDVADGLDDDEAAAVATITQMLLALDDEDWEIVAPLLAAWRPPCRNLDIELDGDLSDWPQDVWLDPVAQPSAESPGNLGKFNAIGTAMDGHALWFAFDLSLNYNPGDVYLVVEMDTGAGPLRDYGFSVRLDGDKHTVSLWHVDLDNNSHYHNPGPIQAAVAGDVLEVMVPMGVFVYAERSVFRFTPYIHSSQATDETTWARPIHIPVEPTAGALGELFHLVRAVPAAATSPSTTLAVALQERYWTFNRGEVSVETIRADGAAFLDYALGLPAWLEEQGLPDHFGPLPLREKLHWAWRAGVSMSWSSFPIQPMFYRPPMTDELYHYWVMTVEDLEWYRNLVVGSGLLDTVADAQELGNELDSLAWDLLFYVTRPENVEMLCGIGFWGPDICDNFEEDWYADGTDLDEIAGTEVKIWTAGSATLEREVFEEKGHFLGDCGNQTQVMRAMLRAMGLAGASGSYGAPAGAQGPVHAFPFFYDPVDEVWDVPQDPSYFGDWNQSPAYAHFTLPPRYPYAYATWSYVDPGVMGGNTYILTDVETYAGVADLHIDGLERDLVRDLMFEAPDLLGNDECLSPELPDYVPYILEISDVKMGDGASLRTYAYRPLSDEPVPTLLFRTMQGWTPETVKRFVADGYGLVVQWVRGRYGSDGPLCLFGCEVADGLDAVDWILEQDWCNGSVGTIGSRYSAFSALAAATHPAVQAVVVEDEPGLDIYHGYPGSPGRLVMVYWTAWLAYLTTGIWPDSATWSQLVNHLGIMDVDQAVFSADFPFWAEYIEHFGDPAESAWRKQHSLIDDVDDICAAVLHIRSDEWIYDGAVRNFETLSNAGCGGNGKEQRLALGVAPHNGWLWGWEGNPDEEFESLIDDFLADHLLADPPQTSDHPVSYLSPQANGWLHHPDFEPTEQSSYHLKWLGLWGGGLTIEEPPNEAWLNLDNAPGTVDPVEESDALSFETEPLSDPLMLFGAVRYYLRLKLDTPDADLLLTLYEKTADSEFEFIAQGGTKLSFRDSGEPSGPVPQGVSLVVEGELTPVAYRVPASSRLYVMIRSQGYWYHENPNTGQPVGKETQYEQGTIQVYAGGEDPSRIIVPLLN